MSQTYFSGFYKLNITCEEFNQMVNAALQKKQAAQVGQTSYKIPVTNYDEFRKNYDNPGVFLLGNDSVGLFGVGYVSQTADRTWIVPAENGHALYMDATPDATVNLGFKYNDTTGDLIHPFTGKVVLNFHNVPRS